MKKVILLFITMSCLLCGCQKDKTPISNQKFCLDTIVDITLYDSDSKDILNHCFDICNENELIFSTTNKNSELYKINHSPDKLKPQKISKALYKVIEEGLKDASISQGEFDITIGAVSSLWNFKSNNPKLPNQEMLQNNLQSVNYQNIILKDQTIQYLNQDTMIDLGAIAKGYIADEIKDYLLNEGVRHALINLGGNVLCVGNKGTENFQIGLTDPLNTEKSILSLNVDDVSIVTSGTYQRNMTIDGKTYHHILNPKTGYSIDNDLSSVTIISKKSITGDSLSTVCFSLGQEKGIELLESMNDVEGCFINQKGHITYTKGFKKYVNKKDV